MAQKRAFVWAILVATGASEFYTQDVEDMDLFALDTSRWSTWSPPVMWKATSASSSATVAKASTTTPKAPTATKKVLPEFDEKVFASLESKVTSWEIKKKSADELISFIKKHYSISQEFIHKVRESFAINFALASDALPLPQH